MRIQVKSHSATLCAALAALIFAGSSQNMLAGEYYRWVDEQGVAHFGELPPKHVQAEKLKTRTYTPPPTPVETSDESDPEPEYSSQPVTDLKDPQRCEGEKKRLHALNKGGRIRMKNDNGDVEYLNAEQIKAEIAKSQQAIRESC